MDSYQEAMERIQRIMDEMQPYASEDEKDALEEIKTGFAKRIKDFDREGRKLNIGVIGRVKAGKSSFLNTLLFGGKEVLPKAATPKTAALTKMEYADENRIVIEFYSEQEWEGIVDDAAQGDKNETTKAAKELVDMAARNHVDVREILSWETFDRSFEEYSELIAFLNDYVGENGTYTPLVRSVSIYMNREEFKEVSIVDTPGLNDPIVSRTQRTKEFISVCDVVFFLSRAGSFLDNNDWKMLCKQLPQKGVKKMVLVASQYDLGLRDVLTKEVNSAFFGNEPAWRRKARSTTKATNVADAKKLVAESLSERIRGQIAQFEESHDSGSRDAVIKLLKECEDPVLVSSRAYDMYVKEVSEYNSEELDDLEYWKDYIPESQRKEEFERIGNFDSIKRIYGEIKAEKQRLMEQKQREFIPNVYLELEEEIGSIKTKAEGRLEYLQSADKDSLEKRQAEAVMKMNGVKADIAEVFGDTLEQIKMQKLDVNKALRELGTEAAKLDTHTGQETHHETHTSYKFKLLFIKLGRQDTSYDYTTTYTYLAASDALEQINAYGKDAASEIEDIFRETVEVKAYRRKLLETVIRNFDSSDERFDSNYFRIIVQKALNSIEFPEVHIDVSRELQEIGNQFSGEVRNKSDQDKFRKLLSDTVDRLYGVIIKKVDTTIDGFRQAMCRVEETLADNILRQISEEFESIKAALQEKEKEIRDGKQYVEVLSRIFDELRILNGGM